MENVLFPNFGITSCNISPEDPLLVINPKNHESLASYFRGALCNTTNPGMDIPLSSGQAYVHSGHTYVQT